MRHATDSTRRPSLSRRQWLRLAAAGAAATVSSSGWIEALAADATPLHPKPVIGTSCSG